MLTDYIIDYCYLISNLITNEIINVKDRSVIKYDILVIDRIHEADTLSLDST